MASFLNQLIDSVLPTKQQPVVPQPALLRAMDVSFVLLLITLFGLAAITDWNLHVLALIGVTVALWASVRWFVAELAKVETVEEVQERRAEGQQQAAKGDAPTRPPPIAEEAEGKEKTE